jgi:LPXTG-motif cell wall-anchored protein
METGDTHHFFLAVLGGLMISLSFLMALIENKAKACLSAFFGMLGTFCGSYFWSHVGL